MEQHARSFNEGYETAVAQGLADNPTLASDWLDEQKRRAVDKALTEVEARLRNTADALCREPDANTLIGLSWVNCTRAAVDLVAALRLEVRDA